MSFGFISPLPVPFGIGFPLSDMVMKVFTANAELLSFTAKKAKFYFSGNAEKVIFIGVPKNE